MTGRGVTLVTVASLDSARDALASASGWVGLLDPGDRLEPDALSRIAAALDDPQVDVVYTDETNTAAGGVRTPFYKPAWSPDRLRCQPYVGRLALVRAELVAHVGGLRPELGVVAEHDLLLRIAERAPRVVHVPEVLCHRAAPWPAPYPSFPTSAVDAAVAVVDAHLERTHVGAAARPHERHDGLLRLGPRLAHTPKVSVVVPTGGARRIVRGRDTILVVNCVRSIIERSTYPDLEVVCVADRDTDPSTIEQLSSLSTDRVRMVDFDEPFHFSRKVNRGALAASGDVLVFLNDDTEVRSPGWLEAMVLYVLQRAVGAVGARLLFEAGTIQHAGVVGVGGNPGHPYHGEPAETLGYGANAVVPGDFLAVTGACLMTRRDVFVEVGGMSQWFPASYNDLDYCLKVGRAGYRVVATPDAVLDHFESSSRDGAVTEHELGLIRRRWGRLLRHDPFYGPNFPSGIADFEPA